MRGFIICCIIAFLALTILTSIFNLKPAFDELYINDNLNCTRQHVVITAKPCCSLECDENICAIAETWMPNCFDTIAKYQNSSSINCTGSLCPPNEFNITGCNNGYTCCDKNCKTKTVNMLCIPSCPYCYTTISTFSYYLDNEQYIKSMIDDHNTDYNRSEYFYTNNVYSCHYYDEKIHLYPFEPNVYDDEAVFKYAALILFFIAGIFYCSIILFTIIKRDKKNSQIYQQINKEIQLEDNYAMNVPLPPKYDDDLDN